MHSRFSLINLRCDNRLGHRHNVYRRRGNDPYSTIDTRARIPTAPVVARISPDGKHIFALLYERRHINTETNVAIVPAPRKLAIDIDARTRHNTVELQPQRTSGFHTGKFRFRDGKRTAIPTNATPRKLTGITVALWIKRSLYRPVMRHLHLLPFFRSRRYI